VLFRKRCLRACTFCWHLFLCPPTLAYIVPTMTTRTPERAQLFGNSLKRVMPAISLQTMAVYDIVIARAAVACSNPQVNKTCEQ
jgi:hypothetical protein